MKIIIDNEEYNVIVTKKITTKNTYIRVKEDLNIYVTCNTFTSNKYIEELINKNINSIRKMLNQRTKSINKKNEFYYLGNKYLIYYTEGKEIKLIDNFVYIGKNANVDLWLKKEAKKIFQEELDIIYNKYLYKIPYPSLYIRSMKTRWGVCNTKLKKVTLNLELIKKDKIYLDYVIVHELSHLIEPNHSKKFWKLVEDNMPDYKLIRKELKHDE